MRENLHTAIVFPSLATNALLDFEGGVIGSNAADQFDKLHQRHGIYEMNADEALGTIGR